MATTHTIEVPIQLALDGENKRRLRAVANSLTKSAEAMAELGDALHALADGDAEADNINGFKVGDRVRCTDGQHEGQLGTVIELGHADRQNPYKVRLDGGNAFQWKGAGWIEHVR